MNSSDIGRYGTLRLMKRLDPTAVVTSFPIDDELVTFGCDTNCSVRLYYPDVSPVHCKIMFRDNKGFLIVLGEAGLLIDGCQVYPSSSFSSPRTIPLTNNSEIEIRGKLFKFTYPPKELRASLVSLFDSPVKKSTTTPGRRRALRMSMIQSAEVFTPKPSHDPRVNLKILQSPLKGRTYRSPVKPRKNSTIQEEDETEIVLVDGNHPRVVEEEKDLVILEDVEVEDIVSPPVATQRVTATPQFQPHTPPRPQVQRSSASLHRAVLIRSAQRAVMKMEMEKEEVEDEKEVVAFVGEVSEESGNEVSADEVSEEDASEEEGEDEDRKSPGAFSRLRKSLEAVTGYFRGTSQDNCEERDVTEALQEDQCVDDRENEPEELHGDNHNQYNDVEHNVTPRASIRPPTLGNFMTPQPQFSRQVVERNGRGAGRHSHGGFGDGPRRVMVEPAWKIRDLVVPEESEEDDQGTTSNESRARVSEEERRAIQDRRKSALMMPTFGGMIPGTRRTPTRSTTPIKEKEETEEDTRVLLEKMKDTVEGMKRRQSKNPTHGEEKGGQRMSLAVRMSLSPSKRDAEFGKLLNAEPGAFEEANPDDNESGESDPERTAEEVIREGTDQQMASEDGDSDLAGSTKETPTRVTSAPPTRTPQMDLRHLFTEPRAALVPPSYQGVKDVFKPGAPGMVTPKMDGVRSMFMREKGMPMPTPVFEGVGQMMKTPAGWRDATHEEATHEEDTLADKPARMSSTRPAGKDTTTSSRRKTPRAAGRATPASDDEPLPVPASTGTRRGRSKHLESDEEESGVPAPPQRKARLIRSKKVSPVEDIPEESVVEKTAKTGRKDQSVEDLAPSKKKTIATPKDADMEEDETLPSAKPARRGRKAAELNDGESKKIASVSKGRQTPKAQMESESAVAPASKSRIRKGRANVTATDDQAQATSETHGTRAKPVESSLDPLDIDHSEPAAVVPDGKRVKNKSRSRTNTAEVLNQEAGTDIPRSSRSKKTPVDTKSKAPTSADNSEPRVRSTRKAAAVSISDSGPAEGNGDKENAPKLADEDEVVKTTTRARRGAAKAKEEPEVVERSRTRTRTRTGGRK